MKYAKIENDIVVQVQPGHQSGFEKAPDSVICGMIKQEDGSFTPPAPVLTQESYTNAAQRLLNEKALEAGYDSIYTAISYEGDAYQKFNDEALSFKAWRSAVWVKSIEVLGKVESGEITQPSIDEFIAMLPNKEDY